MSRVFKIAAFSFLMTAAAHAQSVNRSDNPTEASPGSTGAMQNSTSNGVATDPNGVKEQQGRSSGSSPGTVGAAPGADTKSQTPVQQSK